MPFENESWLSANPAPGYKKYPDHKVECKTLHGTLVITFDEQEIARSHSAILVEESNHTPVYYLPLQDVDEGVLRDSQHESRCPFKGKARYWHLIVGDHEMDNALWSYETPYDEALELAGLVAFYDSKVEIEFIADS